MKEDHRIEWKSSWRDDCLKWICGFANAEGGKLIIGRDDGGKAVGVKDAGKLLEEIPNKVRDILGIMVDVKLRHEEGRELIEICVEPYPSPVNYKGEYFYRTGSTNQALKGAALDRFLLRKHGRTWDGAPQPGLTRADLDAGALKTFRRLALKSQRMPEADLEEPDQSLLEKLHLVEGHYLTHAAALMFHPEPDRFFTGAYVKIGYFESDADLRFQDEVRGDLITQVNRAIEILQAKYLRAWITYEGIQRLETWPIPMPALREALLNAVAHKNYASGIPIQISVYPDKLMIWNPGELPSEWTVEKLLGKHASIPFNPDVANVFFRSGMIEAWGRGVERIMDACREAGNPEPEVGYEPAGLWVVFHFLPEHEAISAETTGRTSLKTPVETSVETADTSVETVGASVETPVEMPVKTPDRILELLRANPRMTLAEVAEEVSKTPRTVERATAKLVAAGRLRYVGPRKGGHWEILG